MANQRERKPIVAYETYLGYLRKVLITWQFWGESFVFNEDTSETTRQLRDDYEATLGRIAKLEGELKLLKNDRRRQVAEISAFATRLRPAITMVFGLKSSFATSLPMIREKDVGRPNKHSVNMRAAAARKRAAKAEIAAPPAVDPFPHDRIL